MRRDLMMFCPLAAAGLDDVLSDTRPLAGLDSVLIPRAPVGHHSHWGLDKLACDLSTLDVHEVRTLDVDEKPDAAY